MSPLNPKPRPVLLPHGWPKCADDEEAFTRVLLAAGADVERMLDSAPGASFDAFVRHAGRMPFLRSGREQPIVAFATNDSDVEIILEMRHCLIETITTLREATWLIYVAQPVRSAFGKAAQRHGGLFDTGGGLVTWHVHYGPIGLVGADTWLAGLSQKLEDVLEPTPASGIIPVEPVYARSSPLNHIPTTQPAPPGEPRPFDDSSPYAAVASRAATPLPRNSCRPEAHFPSTNPPNPRLRKR